MVSIPHMPTVPTLKALALPLTDMLAAVAGLRSVGGVDGDDLHPSQSRLVLHKTAQLVECPTVATAAFGAGTGLGIGSLSDARQVLQRDSRTQNLSLRDDSLADHMVHMLLKTLLFARQPLQQLTRTAAGTACAFRAVLLHHLTGFSKTVTNFCHRLARPAFTGGGNGYIGSPQVNANDLLGFSRRGNIPLDLYVQPHLAFRVHQSGAGEPSALQLLEVVVGQTKVYAQMPFNRGQRNRLVAQAEVKNASVVVHRSGLEPLDLSAQLFCGLAVHAHPRYSPDCEIGAQPKLFPHIPIGQLLNPCTVPDVARHSRVDVVAGIRKSDQRSPQSNFLLGSWSQLYFYGKHLLHEINILKNVTLCDQ